ncbi:MAG: YcxB family protein [Eubacteriaceae bacterium]|nr:YcxB family protein [Eubacteriaceae bacterium]
MFRISYKNDEYIYREFYKYYLFRRPSVFAFWVILISTYFMQLARNRGNWELVSFFPLFMFMQMYIYRSKYRLSYKKACDIMGDPLTYTFVADNDNITFTSSEGVGYDIDYGRLRSYALTGRLIILFTHSKKFYILPVDAFEEGYYSDFTKLLDDKGVKAEKYAK